MAFIDTIGSRIVAHQGQMFYKLRGSPFEYWLDSAGFPTSNVDQYFARSLFEKALNCLPLSGPDEINDLTGPSYVDAIDKGSSQSDGWADSVVISMRDSLRARES